MAVIKRLFLWAMMVLIVVALTEASLNVLCLVSDPVDRLLSSDPRSMVPVADPRLGHRPNPAHPDHDANGFRNPSVPSQSAVVALGDSQTYGMGVLREEAWPRQLGLIGGVSVYSVAYGGYGPGHNLLLLDEALEVRPRVVIATVYSGNDFFDGYKLVYLNGQLPELRSTDPAVLAEIEDVEKQQPFTEQLNALRSDVGGVLRSGWEWLKRHSKLVGVVRALKRAAELEPTWSMRLLDPQVKSGLSQAFDDGRVRTLFTSRYRFTAVNSGDPRMRAGHRVCLESIREMRDRVGAAGARLVVLMIPTKELVFKDAVEASGVTMPGVYRELVRCEEGVWEETEDYFASQGIDFIQGLSALRRCVSEGVNPYPESDDGHPNAVGHHAIAEGVLSALYQLGLLDRPGTVSPNQ